MLLLSDLELARLDSPGTPDAQLVIQLAQRTLDEMAMQPPINHEIVASMRDIINIEEDLIPWAGCLVPGPAGLLMTLRATDCRGKKRFTAFHEVSHTFLPGFSAAAQYRCDPVTPEASRSGHPHLETLCDLSAAELLFPSSPFLSDLAGNTRSMRLVEALADHYDGSLEATARRLVSLHPESTMLVALEPACKPSDPHAQPVLRVQWVHASGRWLFVPKHKSVPDDSPFGRALDGDRVEETASLGILVNSATDPIHISAGCYPYTDHRGEQHMRVLALITPARPKPGISRGH
ncbi:ImmA/IrrE family metallo-endopeptidase [Micromonospora sp. NPDC048930]|uniref:ImmA/IrrE family metallo-endopeptidase n=1 Tax=Micromonospora sp. NPDC048930 TaxID=3364261 RepID=UPI00370FCFF3